MGIKPTAGVNFRAPAWFGRDAGIIGTPGGFPMSLRHRLGLLLAAALLAATARAAEPGAPVEHPQDFIDVYAREVDRRLALPAAEQQAYGDRLVAAFSVAGVALAQPQWVLLVDRSEHVQAAMLWWVAPGGYVGLVGASPVSTGQPGRFEHFETPTGVFAHSLANPDYRAEGTRNANGIRGYGVKGLRVFDFGWVPAPRGWGTPGTQPMRLQVHATDPDRLEPRLGQRESKGCIRIPATLNTLLDRHGVLDADYEAAAAAGRAPGVLRPDRTPTAWPGRWLVVVDSGRHARPPWAPLPGQAPPPDDVLTC